MKQQVHTGQAQVLTTIHGTTPKLYDIRIDQVRYNDSAPTRNMVIVITDEELLEQTGGIVQGMSGSPILQDGMLVGAVTHVFVNDPTKGFAIFAGKYAQNHGQCRAIPGTAARSGMRMEQRLEPERDDSTHGVPLRFLRFLSSISIFSPQGEKTFSKLLHLFPFYGNL